MAEKIIKIDQFRYIKIQPKTIDFNTRLLGINPTNSVVIPMSLVEIGLFPTPSHL